MDSTCGRPLQSAEAGGERDEEDVRRVDAIQGHVVRQFTGHTQWIRSIAMRPMIEDEFATGSDDGSVRVWRMGSGECVRVLRGGGGGVWDVGWSGDGRRLACGSGSRNAEVYEEAVGGGEWTVVSTIDVGESAYGVALNADGSVVVVARYFVDESHPGVVVRVSGARGPEELARLNSESRSEGSKVAWSGDWRHVVLAQTCGRVSVYEATGWGRVWSKQIEGGNGMVLAKTRDGTRMVAMPWGAGRSVKFRVEDGGEWEEVGGRGAIGVCVVGGGRRVVVAHRDPARYEVHGGRERTIPSPTGVASLMCVVDGGGGLLALAGTGVVLIR